MTPRLAAALWLALMAIGAVAVPTLPRWGERLLETIHFEDPDPEGRAEALRVRALHRWEAAQSNETARERLLDLARADWAEAAALSPHPSDAPMRSALAGAQR